MKKLEYTINETAALLSVPIYRLRLWDNQGVLVALRTGGGHRRYPKDLIDRILAGSGTMDSSMTLQLAAAKRRLAEKRRIIQLLVESEGRYRDLVETSHDLIWATDVQGSFTYLNNAANDIFGLPPKDLLGRCFFDFEADTSHVANRRFLSLLRRHGEVKHYVTHLRSKTGEDRWLGINARVTLNDANEMRGIRGTARDITEEQRARLHIEHLAMHDALTDLPNRHALMLALEAALKSTIPGAVLILDIDHFKYVNDHFGHRTGDQIVVGIGSVLREVIQDENGELYRIGGDEFVIHLPETLREKAIATAERALTAIRHYRLQVAEGRIFSNVSASIGISIYPFHGDTATAMLSNTDISLYQAKDLGRNRYVLFDPASGTLRHTHKRTHWTKKLRDALDQDQITLFTQPVVRLHDLTTSNHEILLRIRDDNGAYIAPGNFMGIAESLGIVQEIDLRVISKVIAHIKSSALVGANECYFVNLSGVSMSSPEWLNRCLSLLTKSGVNPKQLVFEITETAALSQIDITLKFIRRMKDFGCRIALDDFGVGFSSFYYLKQFEVDFLKIDGSFIQSLASDNGSRLFVKALTDVAQGMNMQVIAEWVEDSAALDLLKQMGTQYGQGYLFHKPAPLEDLVPTEAPALTSKAS